MLQVGIAANAIAPAAGNSTRRRQAQGQMESLVSRMESVAQRISARNMSASQRSVLVSRFNDLTRRVNLLDGIVAGEGQEIRGRRALSQGSGLSQTADRAATRHRTGRATTGPARGATRGSKPVLFLGKFGAGNGEDKAITAQTVKDIRKSIPLQGLAVIGAGRNTGTVLDILA